MKRKTLFMFGVCICALVLGGLVWKAIPSSGITVTDEYDQSVRNALSELNMPTGNDFNSIGVASDSFSDFMYYRSGIHLSHFNKNTLTSAEQHFRATSKSVDADVLTQIITDIAIERIPTLSSLEISAITDALRGFNSPELPQSFQRGRLRVKLRASGMGQIPANEFSSELTNLRDGGIQSKIAQNLIYVSVASEVKRKLETIRKADPEFFGGTESNMTPLKALLVTYAVVADDSLLGNSEQLADRMLAAQQVGTNSGQRAFPSPNGQRAYGDNGYLYSSPVSIILNDASVTKLLSLIQERGE